MTDPGQSIDSLHLYCTSHSYPAEAKVLAGYQELRGRRDRLARLAEEFEKPADFTFESPEAAW